MSLWVQALVCAAACLTVWAFVLRTMWQATPMNTSKLHLVLAAVLGALLPFIPDLVKLVPLPASASNALCAVILAAAYAIVPKQATPPKGGEAGYVIRRTLFELCGLVCLFAIVACAALQSASKDPLGALQDTAHAYDTARDTASKGCDTARKLVAAGVLTGDKAKAVDKTCKPIEEAARVHVEVTIDQADAGSP